MGTTPTISATVTGTYTLTVNDVTGCSSTTATKVVTAYTSPMIGTYTVPGNTCNAFPTLTGALSYLNTHGMSGPVTIDVAKRDVKIIVTIFCIPFRVFKFNLFICKPC